MSSNLARTPLYSWHTAHGGRMVDFAGWSMPVQYRSIIEEHEATRKAAGLFDISHMGRLLLEGSGACGLLERLLTRRVADMTEGKIRYATVTNEQGGVLDDVLVYRLAPVSGLPLWLLVVNASNRAKIIDWIRSHMGDAEGVALNDRTEQTAMMAVQGPRALAIAQAVLSVQLDKLRYYEGLRTGFGAVDVLVSRTGYTGERGCEVILPSDQAETLWQRIIEQGQPQGLKPAGLGARDTLRLEAGLPLYGHELTEQISPIQAGLGFAVDLEGRQFIGCEALRQLSQRDDLPRRVGLTLAGRRVPRQGCQVLHHERPVGEVTSGTFSPTLKQPIAMAYVEPQVAQVGTELEVDIRGRREPARVVDLPFYSRTRKKTGTKP